MKKTFLIAGLIACIGATNGYAQAQQGVTISYTCPDGCTLSTSTISGGNTSATCWRSETVNNGDGSVSINHYDCDGPEIVVTQNATGAQNNALTTRTKKSAKTITTARAGRINSRENISQIADTIEPAIPQVEEKVASGTVLVSCPDGCKLHCRESADGKYMVCECKTSSGALCEERANTIENTIKGFK